MIVARHIMSDAAFSPCKQYRWWLSRSWLYGHGTCAFVMLNPSIADATRDDPTIRRCIRYAQRWGYQQLMIYNLFPYRSTDPEGLIHTREPHGGERGLREALAACTADCTVLAWGAHPFATKRALEFLDAAAIFFPTKDLWCLGTTRTGQPRHPLYVRADQALLLYVPGIIA